MRDGKRAWRRTGVSKGVLRACLSLSSCQHVLRAYHGESGGRTKVCKNCPPCLPAFNGLQHKIKHIDHTLIRKHGACKGNMWVTLKESHPPLKLPLIEFRKSDYISLLYWNLEWFSAARSPGNSQNIAKGNASPAHSTSNGNSEM